MILGGVWFLVIGVVGFIAEGVHRRKAKAGYRFVETREFAWAKRLFPLLPTSETFWSFVRVFVASTFTILGLALILTGALII
jgi:hypothetical protein